MSLVTQINGVITRIATEFKTVYGKLGNLASLNTTHKTTLVGSINEVLAAVGGGGVTNLAATLSATQTVITSDTGTDATIPAADTTNAGVMTKAMFDKLAAIEAAADVTDAANVDAAGAVMNSDSTTAGMSFVIDEDDMTSNLATKVPTQQSVKAYTDAAVAALIAGAPGALNTLDELAAAFGDDANFATTVANSLATRLRFDAAQTLSGGQQTQGQDNLQVYSRTQIGDPTTDFVAAFEAGLL